jgi:hypothetical protein
MTREEQAFHEEIQAAQAGRGGSALSEAQEQDVKLAEEAADRWYYDGSAFWVRMFASPGVMKKDGTPLTEEDMDWVPLDAPAFKDYLKLKGFSDSSPRGGVENSKAVNEMLYTKIMRRVSYAGPLAGWRRSVMKFDDTRALIIKSPSLPTPREGDTDVIEGFLTAVLVGREEDGTPIDQRPWFYAWWKHALKSLYAGEPTKGLAIAIAGEKGSGKTLLKDLIKLSFGGREVYPYRWMTGEDGFNLELAEAPLWVIDDEAANTRHEARAHLGAEIKKCVAASAIRFRGLHQQARTLCPFRRLVICLNNEPDRLLVLPPMDGDIDDKISLFRGYKNPYPMPVDSHPDKVAFWAKLMEQLPCFVHALLTSDTSEVEEGRFGVQPFHHPAIMQELLDVGGEGSTWELVEKWLRYEYNPDQAGAPNWFCPIKAADYEQGWQGTAQQLREALTSDWSPLSQYERREVQRPAWLGRHLGKLAKRHPLRVIRHRTATSNEWIILKKEKQECVQD